MTYSRRRFLTVIGGACGAVLGVDALALEPGDVLVSRHEVPIRGLHPALDGLRLAHVTDVHFPGNVVAARATLAHLRRERPEIVVMTGDMTEHVYALPSVSAFAQAARGTIATVATLGNWEYVCGAARRAGEAYRTAGADLLVNRHRDIRVGGASLALVGLDDPVRGRPDPRPARSGMPPESLEIWLVHAPGFVSHRLAQVSSPPALVLSGHTHGGQIRLPLLPAITPEGSGRFVAGWYRDTFAPLYVSRGIGTTTIPARFRCPPELPIFTFRRV
jgi:predicted MPP superfamily phosphohydrolase